MFRVITLFIFVVQLHLLIVKALSLFCDKGWVLYGSNCFWKSDTPATRDENLKNCESMGGSLTIIRTPSGNAFVKKFLGGGNDHYWLSGYRVKQGSKEFKWIDGSQLKYSDWNPGEPNDFKNPRPMCLNISPKNRWNDWPCGNKLKQLCEKLATREPPNTTTNHESKCDCKKLTSDVERQRTTNLQHEAAIATLKAENEKLKENNQKCTSEMEAFKKNDLSRDKKIAESKLKIDSCESHILELEGKNKVCVNELDEVRKNYGNSETENNALREQLFNQSYKLVIVK